MAGNPITTQALNHWMYVAAKGQAAQSPGQPVIVPNDPPNFTKCLAQVRQQIPALKKTSDKQIKADCKQLFTSLSSQTMDFLIKAYWYQALAHKLGIKITDAQVQKALDTAKKGQFSTSAQFQQFLTQSGQTMQDILFRVRVQQIYQKLLAKHPTTVTPAQISTYYIRPPVAVRHAGEPEPEDRADQDPGPGRGGQEGAAEGRRLEGRGQEVLDRPDHQEDRRRAHRRHQGPAGPGAHHRRVRGAQTNKLIGPVKGQFGYYVIEVTKITPATQKTLAQSSTLIKQTLTSQTQTAAQNAVDSQAKKAWLSKTKCRRAYAMADCSGYKAPKTSTSPGAAVRPGPRERPERGRTGAAGAATRHRPAAASGGTGTAAP